MNEAGREYGSGLSARMTSPVVLLVDNARRDLDTATLIALHLRGLGIEAVLEPLEAFRAVLAAHRPSMIVFNHLFANHLVEWSKRLTDIGVLTAVLSNEGMYLREDDLRFNSGRYHGDGHLDYFFCWNGVHREALVGEGSYREARIEIVGVPRFDFYFEPWSRIFRRPRAAASKRPHVLACTNFGLAKFWELPREHGDKFFAGWVSRMALYKDYWGAIESNWRSRQRFLDYLRPLVATGKYEITLRPHPTENPKVYQEWIDNLPAAERSSVKIDSTSNITALILDCDVEISGESCTTAVESWIVGKPTVELAFDKHPMLYAEERSRGNVHCERPVDLPAMVEAQLASPTQPELQEIRRRYLEKWCATPDGNACHRVAEIIASAVKSKAPADWSKLRLEDYRRAAKLKTYNLLGQAYHFDPLLSLKHFLLGDRYKVKHYVYEKSIKPRDVKAAWSRLESIKS